MRGWEYCVVAESHNVTKTAGLLNLRPDEVVRVINRHCQSTFTGWYTRCRLGCSTDNARRCFSAPEDPRQILRLATKIAREDFPGVFADEEVMNLLVPVLRSCLRSFDPAAGNHHVPVQRRFLRRVRHFLRKRLLSEARRSRDRSAKQLPALLLEDLSEFPQPVRDENEFELWSWHIYHEALAFLKPAAQKYIALRYGKRLQVEDIAQQLGVTVKTVSNSYGQGRLTRLLREAVRALVRGLPQTHLRGVVGYLLRDGGLSEEEVARLLLLPLAVVQDIARRGVVPGLERDQAMALLRAPSCVARAA
jgi:RNA polymerase sigma factor (sigma-70 family)